MREFATKIALRQNSINHSFFSFFSIFSFFFLSFSFFSFTLGPLFLLFLLILLLVSFGLSVPLEYLRSYLVSKLRNQQEMFCFKAKKRNISQKCGSCLSPSFLLQWPTQSLPLPSTTAMTEFCVYDKGRVHKQI